MEWLDTGGCLEADKAIRNLSEFGHVWSRVEQCRFASSASAFASHFNFKLALSSER